MKKVKDYGYQIIRPLLKVFIVFTINPKVINKNNIPKKEGFILAGNHCSYYDPIIVGNTTSRSVHFLAKKELFDKFLLGPILRFMGIISVDRKKDNNPLAKEQAIDALKEGKVICIFPEGTINNTDDLILPFKYGAVSFAKKTGCPIIPFAIVPKPKIFRYKTRIIIGKPFFVNEKDNLGEANKKLEDIVKILLKKIKS